MITNYVKTIEERCDKDEETGCWNWTRATHTQGYAFMRHGGQMRTVQRILAIELELFPIDGIFTRITNKCANKLCCNPDHIVARTHSEINNIRYAKYGTNGVLYGKEFEVLTEYNHMKENKIVNTIGKMADKYGVSPAIVYRAINKAKKHKI